MIKTHYYSFNHFGSPTQLENNRPTKTPTFTPTQTSFQTHHEFKFQFNIEPHILIIIVQKPKPLQLV
jgi:hypothetical protein